MTRLALAIICTVICCAALAPAQAGLGAAALWQGEMEAALDFYAGAREATPYWRMNETMLSSNTT